MPNLKAFTRRGFIKSITATLALLFSRKSFAKLGDIAFWKSGKVGAGKLFLWNDNWDGVMGLGISARSWTQLAPSVSSLAAGASTEYAHTGHIKTDGTLWMVGRNYHGQLGDGSTTYRSSPVQVTGSWNQVAIGDQATLAIRTNGTLWAWGGGWNGQLGQGNGDSNSYSSPVQVPGSWSMASAHQSSAAIRTDGTLFTWGINGYGQLGTGNTSNNYSPIQVPGSWSQVAAGLWHMAAVRTDGSLYAWGRNNRGQLGQGNTTNRSSPVVIAGTWTKVRVGHESTYGFKAGDQLFSWGANDDGGLLGQGTHNTHTSSPVQVPGAWLDVCDFGRWGAGMAGLKTAGTVWTWGYGANDLIRNGLNYPPISPHQVPGTGFNAITGGHGHLKAKKADGTLWVAGYNTDGNQGLGYNFYSPVQVPGSWVMVGSNFGWRGWGHAAGIKAPDSLWVWGNDFYAEGVMGQGNGNSYYSPVQITGQWRDFALAEDATLGLRTNGTLWSWGYNYSGILGINNNSPQNSPVQVVGSWIAVSASGWRWNQAAAGIKTDFTLWTWGTNYHGILGINLAPGGGRSSPTQVPGSWTQVAVGYESMCAIRTDGSLYCWGLNDDGQLGNGNTTRQSSPVQVPGTWSFVNVGEHRAFGIKSDGTLWGWGSNNAGTLGVGNTTNRSSPTQIPGSQWKAVSASTSGSGAYMLRGDGTMWITGQNYAHLGNGVWDSNSFSSPFQVPGTWKALGKHGFGALKDS